MFVFFFLPQEDQGVYHSKVRDMISDNQYRLLVSINDLRRKNEKRASRCVGLGTPWLCRSLRFGQEGPDPVLCSTGIWGPLQKWKGLLLPCHIHPFRARRSFIWQKDLECL